VEGAADLAARDGRRDGSSPLLAALMGEAAAWDHPVWLVGGTVRDRELGRFSPDIDAVTPGDPAQLARRVARRLGTSCFPLSAEFGAYRVVGPVAEVPDALGHTAKALLGRVGSHLDIAALRGGSLDADLACRDFTVNAMALPLAGGALIDPFGGCGHLAEGRLLPVGPTIFADDPLRLMRAARFEHVLGLEIGPELRTLVRAEAARLPAAAAERILGEMVLTLEAGRSAAAATAWDDLGLLEVVLPEVAALRDVGQSAFHHHDVLGHTLEALEHLDRLITEPGRLFGSSWEVLERRLSQPVDGSMSRPVALRLAMLLHDVAKPETRTVDGSGRVIFWGHTELGGQVAEAVGGRLRCSSAVSALARTVAERHLDIGFLQHREPLPKREIVRFLWRSMPWEPEVIMVSVADRLATRGPSVVDSHVDGHLAVARTLMDVWRERLEHGVPSPPIDGDVVMKELALAPGPLLGEVMREVRLAWEAGELRDRAAALALAADHLDGLRRGATGDIS